MADAQIPFSLGKLPFDIGQLVLEHHISSCPDPQSYALASKQVQRWVDRILYRHVQLRTREQGELFRRTVQKIVAGTSSKPADFLNSSVKTIYIKWTVEQHDILPILQACGGVTSVACYVSADYVYQELADFLVDPTTFLRVTKLSILFPQGHLDFTHSIFRSLTHLEILWRDWDNWEWDRLALLSLAHLTHISVDMGWHRPVVDLTKVLLQCCPRSLLVFVLSITPSSEAPPDIDGIRAIHEGQIDPRAVVIYAEETLESYGSSVLLPLDCAIMGMTYNDCVYAWSGYIPDGFVTFWEHAERWIAQRQQAKTSQNGTSPSDGAPTET